MCFNFRSREFQLLAFVRSCDLLAMALGRFVTSVRRQKLDDTAAAAASCSMHVWHSSALAGSSTDHHAASAGKAAAQLLLHSSTLHTHQSLVLSM
jgi:hypothetical protein